MFDAWEHQSDAARAKRFTGATAAAMVVMAALASGLLVMASRPAEASARAKKVDVSFRPPPPPPEPAKIERPPPPKPKPPAPVVQAAAPAPAPMVAPKEIPKEAAPEADAAHAVAAKDVAVGGTGDGSRAHSDGDESAAPVVASAGSRGPVNLPEDAEPPEPDENNEQPEYPESARATGQEARVVLKIVVEVSGLVGRIVVLKGEEPFTSVALTSVKRWKYEPAKLDGAPISVFKIVDLKFRLRSE